ncbi:MAG TPA: hypothetical protein VHV30_08645 [Polyangiaceae bacterium]|jgi:hypothetical protein|nr:hypothetical protein [Polyangiaceae bacterium]
MPEERDKTTNANAASAHTDSTLSVAGLLFVGPLASGKGVAGASAGGGAAAAAAPRSGVWVGPAAGWHMPRGIHAWERELSFVTRASLTPAIVTALRATLPVEQIAPKRFPVTAKAAAASPLIGLASNLVQPCLEQGLRVHTIGVDRVSGDIYYFEEGGGREAVRIQGSLVDMLGPSLKPGTTNDEIAVMMDGLLDRMLLALSEGEVSELDVELADALPRLSRDGKGLDGTNLEAFEAEAVALAARASRFEEAARQIPDLLSTASRRGQATTAIPVFGEAAKETKPALDLLVSGKPLQLSPQPIWTVKGAPRLEEKPAPAATKAAATKAEAKPKVEAKPVDAKPAAKPAAAAGAKSEAAKPEAAPEKKPEPKVEPKPEVRPRVESKPEVRPRAESKPEVRPRVESKPEVRPRAESKPDVRPPAGSDPRLDPKKPAPSPRPAQVAAKTTKEPSPAPAPVRPRLQSSVDTMRPPAPALNHVSERPPPSPRQGTRPLPLQTPVPPAPSPVAPLISTPPGSTPALTASDLPLAAEARTGDAEANAATTAKDEAATEGAVKGAKGRSEKEKSPPLPILPSVASSATKPKRSSATWVVVAFAILAIAYVAMKSFH